MDGDDRPVVDLQRAWVRPRCLVRRTTKWRGAWGTSQHDRSCTKLWDESRMLLRELSTRKTAGGRTFTTTGLLTWKSTSNQLATRNSVFLWKLTTQNITGWTIKKSTQILLNQLKGLYEQYVEADIKVVMNERHPWIRNRSSVRAIKVKGAEWRSKQSYWTRVDQHLYSVLDWVVFPRPTFKQLGDLEEQGSFMLLWVKRQQK